MYASMFSLVLFMILFESRYPKKKTMTLTISLMGPLMIANFVMLLVLGPVVMSTLLLLTCSLPSLIFFWFLAKYRDGRFLFTFCFADTIMLEIIDLTSILDFFLGDTYIFMAIARLLLCPAVAYGFWKWIRPTYLNLQKKVTKGWYTFAAIALIFYVMMSLAMTVPTHITQRLDQLCEQVDMVIVDTPPIGMVIDAAEIASSCDGIVLVVDYNKTRLREVKECKRQMEQSGTPVLGCIINKVSFASLSAKKYYNKSYYSHYRSGYYRKEPSEKADN